MRVCRRRVRAAFRRNLFLHFHMHYFINKWWPYSPCANLSPTHHEMGSNRILSLSSVGWHCCLHSCTVHSVEQQSATSCEAPSFKARRVQVGVFVYAINVMSPAPTTLFEQAARVHWMDDGHWHNAMCVCERWNSSRNGTLKQQHEKKTSNGTLGELVAEQSCVHCDQNRRCDHILGHTHTYWHHNQRILLGNYLVASPWIVSVGYQQRHPRHQYNTQYTHMDTTYRSPQCILLSHSTISFARVYLIKRHLWFTKMNLIGIRFFGWD